MDKKMRLPDLPPPPVRVMKAPEKRALFDILRGVPKDELWRAEVQDLVRQGYARIWAHLCLAAGFAPPDAANCTCKRHREVLPAFCRAVGKIGLHDPSLVPDYHAPQVAILAAEMWREGRGASGAKPCTPDEKREAGTGWVDSLAPAGAFRDTVRTSRIGMPA